MFGGLSALCAHIKDDTSLLWFEMSGIYNDLYIICNVKGSVNIHDGGCNGKDPP